MARINLLPWRAERRKQRQVETYRMLGAAAVCGLLLAFLIWKYFDNQIEGQIKRNDYLTQEIARVVEQNKEIDRLDQQRERLLARKVVIEELQVKRSQMVHLFDSLVRTIPDGVVLTGLQQSGETLTLEGRTQSNARVSTYMRNLEKSGWMSNPELSIIEAKAQDTGKAGAALDVKALPYMFILKVSLPTPSAPEIEEAGLVEDTFSVEGTVVPEQAPAAEQPVPAAVPAETANTPNDGGEA